MAATTDGGDDLVDANGIARADGRAGLRPVAAGAPGHQRQSLASIVMADRELRDRPVACDGNRRPRKEECRAQPVSVEEDETVVAAMTVGIAEWLGTLSYRKGAPAPCNPVRRRRGEGEFDAPASLDPRTRPTGRSLPGTGMMKGTEAVAMTICCRGDGGFPSQHPAGSRGSRCQAHRKARRATGSSASSQAPGRCRRAASCHPRFPPARSGPGALTSRFSSRTAPVETRIRPAMRLSNVDLPQPEWPMIEW